MKDGSGYGNAKQTVSSFFQLALELLEKALQKSSDNEELRKVRDIFRSMLEGGN